MSAHQRFERLQRDAAYRFRSKVHAQSTGQQKRQKEFSYSPLAKASLIAELTKKHKEKPIGAIAELATREIRKFKIPTLEEDPYFKASRIVLQAIGHFKLASEQTCADIIEMHCLHTFGLNAKAIGDLFSIMQRMPVPRQTEAVLRLAPRVDMVALDLTVVECSRVLRALGRCNAAVRPASTVKALCATIKKFAADETNPLTICGTICAVAECDVTQARVLLGVYSDLLQRVIAEPSDADHDILREVVFTLSAVGQGPRQLLNSVCRTSVRVGLSLSAEDIANVIHCMHVCSHRGEAVMRRLASLQLTQPEKQTPETVALTLAGMAHFNIFDNELYCGLMRCTAASMDGEHAASVVHSCLRVLCFQEWVWELVLRPAFLSHLPRQSTRALGAVLLYIAEGKLCETRARETSMILTELSRRDDVQTRENVLRAVLALQQQTKSAAMLEQLATLTSVTRRTLVARLMISDAVLQNADFDEADYLKRALQLPSVEGEQARLSRCIEHIQNQIRVSIAENTEPLLQQVDSAIESERSVGLIRGSISSLSSSSQRLRHTIEEPFFQISAKLCEVRHAQEALECLRNVQRLLTIVPKLPELLTSDVARAARSLRDVEELLASGGGQLHGIHVVDRQLDAVTRCSASIRSKAHELLKSSLIAHNQTELAVAIQCFFSLGTLARVASNVAAEHKREAVKVLVRELDPQAISNAATDGKQLCDLTFAKLEAVLSDIVHRNSAVLLLWKVMTKRKDPTTQEFFASAFEDGAQHLLTDYWNAVASQLAEKIAKLAKRANIRAMIVAQYQRWFVTLRTFCKSCEELFGVLGKPELVETLLTDFTKDVEEEFATLSLERLRDKVQHIVARIATSTPSGGAENIVLDIQVDLGRPVLPSIVTSIDVKSVMKLISQDMTSHRQDQHTLTIVMRNAVVCLQQLKQKMSDAVQKLPLPPLPSVTGPPTATQVFHISMANACATLFADVANIVGMLPAVEAGEGGTSEYSAVHSRLRDASNTFEAIAAGIIAPFFSSAEHALLKCVSSCCGETSDATAVDQLQARVNHIASRFLLLCDRSTPRTEQIVRRLLNRLALRAQVRVLLVRPVSESHRGFLTGFLNNLPRILQHLGQLENRTRLQLRAVRSSVAVPQSAGTSGWLDLLAHVHPLLTILAAVQRVPLLDLGPITSEPPEKFVETAENIVAAGADATHVWASVRKAVASYESKPLSDASDLALRAAVLQACSSCGNDLLAKS